MGQSILIAPSRLPYGAANSFLHDLAMEWQRLGHEVTTSLDGSPDWLVSVNVSGLTDLRDPRLAGISRLALIVDDPLNCYGLYFYPLYNFYPAYVDRTFCDVVGQLDGWQNKPLYCPHGAVVRPVQEGKRPIDILFCGSDEGPDEPPSTASLPFHWRGWAEEYLRGERRGPISLCLTRDDWSLLWRNRELGQWVQALDHYVRSRRRRNALHRLAEAGLTVDLYGKGWDSMAHLHRVHGPLPFEQTIGLMGQSKIVLNLMPNFAYALHERLLTAMAAGAVVATDGNELICSEFREGEELLLFEDPDELVEKVAQVLRDEGSRQKMSHVGRQKVLERHTWAHRARLLHDQLLQ